MTPALRFSLLTALILAAAASRLAPHPWNVTPLGAIALFGGAFFANRAWAFIVTFLAMFLSDVALSRGNPQALFHPTYESVYFCMAVNVCLGSLISKRRTPLAIGGAGLLGAVIFFVVTNLHCWWVYQPRTWHDLVQCYVLAIPYFRNSLLGDAFYITALFGSWALIQKWVEDRGYGSQLAEIQGFEQDQTTPSA